MQLDTSNTDNSKLSKFGQLYSQLHSFLNPVKKSPVAQASSTLRKFENPSKNDSVDENCPKAAAKPSFPLANES